MERESTLISSSLPDADDGKLSAAWSIKSTNTTTISTAPSDSLTQLEVVGIITVLEDCVDQLVVLGLTGNKPQYEDKTTFKSLEERFGDVPKDESINFQKTKLLDVSKGHTKLDKIHKNSVLDHTPDNSKVEDRMLSGFEPIPPGSRAFLQETVRAALTELETSNTFTCLTDVVNNVTRMKKDEEGLILEGAGKTVELAYLKNQLRREQITRANDIGLREELIAKLKSGVCRQFMSVVKSDLSSSLQDDLQTQFFQDQMEQEFVNRWESARCEQNAERLDKTVSGLKEQEDLLKHNMDTEMRVHTDTVNFLSQAIQVLSGHKVQRGPKNRFQIYEEPHTCSLNSKIEAEQQSWINRYDSEMDEREVELNLLKNKKAEDYKELEDLALVVSATVLHLPAFLPTCLSTFLPTHLPACLPACLPTCLPTYLPACLPACLSTYLPACLPSYLPTCLPTYLPAFLPTFLPTCLPSYLPACLPVYLPVYLPACLPTYLPAYVPIYQPTYLPDLETSQHLTKSVVLAQRADYLVSFRRQALRTGSAVALRYLNKVWTVKRVHLLCLKA
uniref:Uncharacterized protein n=1 Tax=Timema poppense TaxID=170557 RepID=A0A7R9D8R6_TIMPO|nr:unnamed protein product [Timema poppensis]